MFQQPCRSFLVSSTSLGPDGIYICDLAEPLKGRLKSKCAIHHLAGTDLNPKFSARVLRFVQCKPPQNGGCFFLVKVVGSICRGTFLVGTNPLANKSCAVGKEKGKWDKETGRKVDHARFLPLFSNVICSYLRRGPCEFSRFRQAIIYARTLARPSTWRLCWAQTRG